MDYEPGVATDVLVAEFIQTHGHPRQDYDLETPPDLHDASNGYVNTASDQFLGEESSVDTFDSISAERRPTSELFEKLHSRVSALSRKLHMQTANGAPGAEGMNEVVEETVRIAMNEMEGRLENLMEMLAEDLTQEVGREQQHLMLMQGQVDKQGQLLTRELTELNRRMEQEKTQRSFVQRSVRDTKDLLQDQIQSQAREVEALRARLADLETPWLVKLLRSITGAVYSCSVAGLQRISAEQQYRSLPSAAPPPPAPLPVSAPAVHTMALEESHPDSLC